MGNVSTTSKSSLPRNVRLLIGMRGARSLGQGAMVAAFALYLHALGWTATAIGAVLMGALLFGTLLTIIVGPLSMLTTTPWLLIAAAVIGGFGRGANGSAGPFSPVEQAWLAIELPMARRGSVFSANSAVGFIGMGIGALLAALPAWWMGHAMSVDDSRLLFVLPLIAYWFAIKFQRGLIDIGPGIALGFIASAAGSFLAGAIARRHGIMKTVLWMRGVGIALLVAMPLVPWFWAAMGLYIVRGAGNGGTGGVRQALAAGLTRVERRGLASSLQNISIQLPRAVGPVIGGMLFHAGYLTLPFLIGAALQLGYLVLYARFFSSHEAARVREA